MDLLKTGAEKFSSCCDVPYKVAAFAPGRIEVLGNHTDYNEGFVLSAAIDRGIIFLATPRENNHCELIASDLDEKATFDLFSLEPDPERSWVNYVKGMLAGLARYGSLDTGFCGLITSNLPVGSGLSSSAALEMASGLALAQLFNIEIKPMELAKVGQAAEHDFVGAKCGLLDQVSSLFGREDHLVLTDFRTLEVSNIPMGDEAQFLMCNTHAAHAHAGGEYNERREKCEEAAKFFAAVLDHPVTALRDVSMAEWEAHRERMDPLAAKRAAHPIGEDERVLAGVDMLKYGRLDEFGKLMYESHRSSIENFENSCPELDFIVEESKNIEGVLGARLSGGGFGGSAVVLVRAAHVEETGERLAAAYEKQFGQQCDIEAVRPGNGAGLIPAH